MSGRGFRGADGGGLDVASYAIDKALPEEWLRDELGLRDVELQGSPAIAIPYRDQDGADTVDRHRVAMNGPNSFRWRRGTKAKGLVYGLERHKRARAAGLALVVEGESDVQTAALHDVVAFGIPGVELFDDELTSPALEGFELVFVQEPGDAGETLLEALRRSRLREHVRVTTLGEHKDLSALHLALGGDREPFRTAVAAAIDAAVPLEPIELDEEPAAEAPTVALRFVPAADFIKEDEPSAEPLLGAENDVVLARGGTMIGFGDGGAGKTTVEVDLIAHLASGSDWHGIAVPDPVKIGLIENEGPRGLFRLKLRRKAAAWEGKPFIPNLYVLEEPWARTSFGLDEHKAELARWIVDLELDLVVAGPMKNLGTVGGGTLEDVAVFAGHLTAIRAAVGRPVAFLLIHHENAAGEISGAWEGEPDTLLHVKEGHDAAERTVLLWRKVRWSSRLHGKKMVFGWAPGEGYELIEGPEGKPDRDLRAELLELAAERSAGEWRTLKEWSAPKKDGGIGAAEPDARKALDGLTTERLFAYSENRNEHGRSSNAKCWSYCDEGSSQSVAVELSECPGGGDCDGARNVSGTHQSPSPPHSAEVSAATPSSQSHSDDVDPDDVERLAELSLEAQANAGDAGREENR